jgi:hypothetical protein
MILRWPAEGLATFAAILCLTQKPVKENAARQTARAPGARAQLGNWHVDGTTPPANGHAKR